jgi:hypothetical protein
MSITKFIKKICVQTAVYWGNPHADGFGDMAYDTPVEIKVRWTDVNDVVLNNKGQEVVSKAHVLLSDDLDIDGYLWLGTISTLPDGVTNPIQVSGSGTIIKVSKTPLLKSTTEFVRNIYLG